MYAMTATVELTTSAGTVDITGDVLAMEGVTCTRGRRQSGPEYVLAEPGQATFWLNNGPTNSGGVAGYYSPYHASVRQGFGLRNLITIKLACPTHASGTVVWKGRISNIAVDTGQYGTRRVRITAEDAVANLANAIVKGISLQTSKRQDELIDLIFTNTDDPDYDTQYTVTKATGTATFGVAMDISHDSDTAILEEAYRIVASERGRMYCKRGSVLAFESRSTWAAAAVSHTLSNDMVGLALRTSSDDLIQKINIDVYPTTKDGSDVVLYSLGTTTTLIQPGEVSTALFGPFRNPNATSQVIGGTDFATVTSTTDYTMNAAEDGGGSDLTANFTVVASTTAKGVAWTITNNGTTAGYITKLQLRGRGIYRTRTTLSQTFSAAEFGARTVTIPMPYQSDISVGRQVLGEYAATFSRPGQPLASSVTFLASDTNDLADAAVLRDQGDRIAITETQSGLSAREYIIGGQRYEIQAGGLVWCTWYLEAVNMTSWQTPTYAAGSYTANNSMTWTVQSGDVTAFEYLLQGDTLVMAVHIEGSTVGGTPSTELRIALPDNRTVAKATGNPCQIKDGGSWVEGLMFTSAGDAFVRVSRADGGNFSSSTNDTAVIGGLFIEVAV